MDGNRTDSPTLWLGVGGAELPLATLLVFIPARLLAELFQRLRLPPLRGEILAGAAVWKRSSHT